MPNQYVNKVQQSNGTVLIDITDTTAVASDVATGKYFYLATGEKVEGTSSGGGTPAISVVDTTDSHGGTVRTITALDISDTTAVASDVAQGKYFYTAQGVKTAGTGSGGGGITTAEIAQQQTINVEGYFTSITASTGLVDGGAYMYTIDGTEFVGTAFPNGSMLYVNSGQTYAIGDNNGYLYLVTQSTGQHTVKVERLNL